ncbi:hypothetical protein CRM22_003487, partial [Opisthorchis felineus]
INLHVGCGKHLRELENLVGLYAPVNAKVYEHSEDSRIGLNSATSTHQSHSWRYERLIATNWSEPSAISYRCRQCPKTFQYSSWRGRHMKALSELRTHKCEFCPCYFKSVASQDNHMIEQHWGELLDREIYGETEYSRLIKRTTHMCHRCGKRFCWLASLDKHASVHTKERQYACELCGYKFTQEHNLKRHAKLYHRDAVSDN